LDFEQYHFPKLISRVGAHMPLRVFLPVLSVILAAVLFHVGDMQAERILNVRRQTGFVEPVPDSYARAKYLDYVLNVPAWAILGEQRGMLWSPSTYWRGRDLRYFLAVILLWYIVGRELDNKLAAKRFDSIPQRTWWGRILALLCALYGLFLCYLMVPEFVPLRGYGYWLPLRRYEPWFIAAVISWGTGMALSGLYYMFRCSGPAGTATAGRA
jgi:hypothetical protein